MKVCPVCNNEFADNVQLCPDDNAELEAAETVENASETETVELSETEKPTINLSKDTIDDDADDVEEESIEEAKTADEISEDVTPEVKTATVAASSNGGMSAASKALIVVLVIALLGGGLLFWKLRQPHTSDAVMTKITKEEMEFLLKDAPPMALKRLEDPEVRKQQVKSLREMLAMASAAQKEGLTKDEKIKAELEDIRIQLTAVNYDREINKDKGPMPPFGFIGEDQINAFWANSAHEGDFKKFFDTKVAMAKENKQIAEDREPSEEDIKQAKEYYAKTRIYYDEAEKKKSELSAEYNKKVELSTKLQQAQFLSRLYAEKVLAEKVKVTDEDVQKYLAEHPELQPSPEIKQKAEAALQRVKNGEDFAAVAKEVSEDPGSKDKGGLYENVTQGQMVPEFEKAALALEPGQIAPELVETKYGYHIIKLEKKGGEVKGADGSVKQTYDARHILFLTTVKDPNNPLAQPMSAKEAAESKLEEEKQTKVLDEVVANNPVEVAEDFEIPKVSDEELQKMQQQMMQQMQPQQLDEPKLEKPKTDAPKTDKKTDTKKK
jgi:parvulin-like peptidyl-prolyl isomerase